LTENDAKIMRRLAEKPIDEVSYILRSPSEKRWWGQPNLESRISHLVNSGLVIHDVSDGRFGTYSLTSEGRIALEDYELQQKKETRHKRISLLIAAVAVIIPLAAFLWGGDGLLNKPNQPTTHISAETPTPPPSTSSPQLTPVPPKSNLETQTSSPPPTVNPHMTNLETWTAPPEPTLAQAQNEAPPPYSLELVSAYMENDCYHVEVSYSTNKDGRIIITTDRIYGEDPDMFRARVSRATLAGDSGTATFNLYGLIPGQNIMIQLEYFDRTSQEWVRMKKLDLENPYTSNLESEE